MRRPANGRTGSDGKFRLTTFRTDDGALPGEYKVVVQVEVADEKYFGKDPEKFSLQEKMETRMSMSPMGRKKTSHKQKPASPVPAVYSDPKRTPLNQVVPPAGKIELALQSGAR